MKKTDTIELVFYSSLLKVNKGFYKNKIGTFIGETYECIHLKIEDDCIVFFKFPFLNYLEIIK